MGGFALPGGVADDVPSVISRVKPQRRRSFASEFNASGLIHSQPARPLRCCPALADFDLTRHSQDSTGSAAGSALSRQPARTDFSAKMGFLDFVKSDEKRASSVEEERVASHGEAVEADEAGDDLHRGMKPRQLSM